MPKQGSVTISIYRDLCKGCRLCIASCGFDVLEMSQERGKQGYPLPTVARPKNCRNCLLCELSCPDMAIEVSRE